LTPQTKSNTYILKEGISMKKEKPEFVATKNSKPGAVKKAERMDTKQDKKLAKKAGVKFTGY
jgi:hypothetical protein